MVLKVTPLQKSIIKMIQKEDKSRAWYLLLMLDHEKYFYQYKQFYTKPEIKKLLIGYALAKPELFKKSGIYRELFNQ